MDLHIPQVLLVLRWLLFGILSILLRIKQKYKKKYFNQVQAIKKAESFFNLNTLISILRNLSNHLNKSYIGLQLLQHGNRLPKDLYVYSLAQFLTFKYKPESLRSMSGHLGVLGCS